MSGDAFPMNNLSERDGKADDSLLAKPSESVNVKDGPMSALNVPGQPRRKLSPQRQAFETDDLEPGFTDVSRKPSSTVGPEDFAPGNGLTPPPEATFPFFNSQRPDVHIYQQKKTLAQGMMDLALLSANANQLRYVVETNGNHPFFYVALTMILLSIIMQVAVGIGLIWNSRYNVKDKREICKAERANNWTVIGIFLVTVLNILIAAFGIIESPPAAAIAIGTRTETDDLNANLTAANSTDNGNFTNFFNNDWLNFSKIYVIIYGQKFIKSDCCVNCSLNDYILQMNVY